MKKRKQRKPKLEGWDVFFDSIWESGPGVLHKKSGHWWVGTKNLEKIGKFFLAAAKWARELEKCSTKEK